MKKCGYYLFSILSIILISGEINAQFISNKGKPEQRYLNYSGRNYENYSTEFLRRKFFDNFGNFLVDGATIFELSEAQSQLPTGSLLTAQSDLVKSRYYSTYFTNLVIGNDSYGGFQTRLIVGDAIRTKFTNLTLNKARFNGIRWDGGTSKYRGTLLASRISDPIRFRFDDVLRGTDGIRRLRDWTQYLFGGHFETDIGDILTLGVTYVNQHQRRSSIDSKESSLKGVVTNVIPRIIFVRISDDSPNDNSGPIIFGPPSVIINGRVKPAVNIHNQIPSAAATSLQKPIQYYVLRNNEQNEGFTINDKNFFSGSDSTNYSSYYFYKNRYSIPPPNYPVMVPSSDRENITYAFVIPDDKDEAGQNAESVQFQIILANDYKVETAQDYVNMLDTYTGDARFTPHYLSGTGPRDGPFGTPTPFFVRARANGNVRDASNRTIITIDYGLTSGMSVYGLNFNFKYAGFEIEGEFNESVEFMKYPLLSGSRFESKGQAWYIKGKKKLGRFTLGGERYKISPTYVTWLNAYVLENSYYSSWDPFSQIPAPIPPDYLGFDGSWNVPYTILLPGGAFYPLVDDNDDDDRWEDGFYHYNVKIQSGDPFQRNYDVVNTRGDYFKLGYRQNVNELRSLSEIVRKPDAGIFPGKDRDNDGIPDDDRNADGVPDFAQDFLTYYADPPTFDYGDDWNNNGIIDEQENDILPDYPYEPDIDGYHVFSNLELLDGLNFTLGKINEKGIARGGVNDINYLKASYFTSTPKFGSLRLYYVLKQVQDNIQNNSYQFKGVITVADPFPDFVNDPLDYRNSLSNSLYLGTTYTQIRNLNIENNIRIELNKQFSLGTREKAFLLESRLTGDQVPGRIVLWGIVNKIDYTYSFFNGALKLSPQFKVRTRKVVRDSEDISGNPTISIEEHQQEIMPIFRIDYKLTENTFFRLGFQGFTLFGLTDFFLYRIRNFKDNVDSRNLSTFAVSLSNKAQYSGYNVVFDFGYKHTDIAYLRPEDRNRGAQESTIFFTVYAGF